jgi:hypothetical protein
VALCGEREKELRTQKEEGQAERSEKKVSNKKGLKNYSN